MRSALLVASLAITPLTSELLAQARLIHSHVAKTDFSLLPPPVKAPSAPSLPFTIQSDRLYLANESWAHYQHLDYIDPDLDACAHAANHAKINNNIVPFKYAKGCYEQFAFSPQIRDDTIDSISATLESFYVFQDIAKAPPLMENSELEPVDLSYELEQLKHKTYATDYAFHTDLSHVISRLQDPHTTYRNMCYHQFVFVQPLSTYGVYEDGQQRVKVANVLPKLDPRLSRDLLDCEVTHIDGMPAFDVMVEYVRAKPYSKDRGVRLNKAFSNLVHDRTGSYFDRYTLGAFAQRSYLPHNSSVTYTIDCSIKNLSNTTKLTQSKRITTDGKKEDATASVFDALPLAAPLQTTLVLEWSALDASTRSYNSTKSFCKEFCTFDGSKTTKKFVLDNAIADDFQSGHGLDHDIRLKSRELYRGPYASFHLLQDGLTAVFRLATEEPHKDDKDHRLFYTNIDEGMEKIKNAGATRLIIDLQNNSGGIICWGRYVLQTLFPRTVDSPYIYNLRASPLAQALAISTFSHKSKDDVSPYEGLIDPVTGEQVPDESWMVPGIQLVNRTGQFSHRVTDRFCSRVARLKDSDIENPFEAKDIALLTNGYCGSTCAVLALQLKERHCDISTVTIGGHHDQSMMFTSFPGGAVQANNTLWIKRIRQLYSTLPDEVRTPEMDARVPKFIPANGQLAFTFREVMSASQPAMVSEYMRIPSDYRMDYTTARFRLPSILWEDVRKLVWGDPEMQASAVNTDTTDSMPRIISVRFDEDFQSSISKMEGYDGKRDLGEREAEENEEEDEEAWLGQYSEEPGLKSQTPSRVQAPKVISEEFIT
ncbi:hypothetical protein DFQ27_005795 [Actinomortierella ambigua]|uniref:Tail specific protease domain-containing protein n=1 Tax=Actinomortierella ambigua TaxID=1343610 RepID=A0A9P6PXS1_9FUNG|nr:hypothetical protein DFQ27_005795 [Actinomortierella ambigua]